MGGEFLIMLRFGESFHMVYDSKTDYKIKIKFQLGGQLRVKGFNLGVVSRIVSFTNFCFMNNPLRMSDFNPR